MTSSGRLGAGPLDRLLAVTEPWLSCDECFEDLDVVIDAVVRFGAGMNEALRVHLGDCGVCDEEADALAALVADGLRVPVRTAHDRLVSAKHGIARPVGPVRRAGHGDVSFRPRRPRS